MKLKTTALAILIVCCTVDLTNACTSCPLSWMSLEKTCVKLFQPALEFEEAENACKEFKVNDCDGTVLSEGHLVSIQSQQEQDVLVELVQQTLVVENGWEPQVYIGMSVGSAHNQLTWTDGSNVIFTSWFPGEPNNVPNTVGAIAAGRYSQGNWADVFPRNRFPYICELPCLEYEVSP